MDYSPKKITGKARKIQAKTDLVTGLREDPDQVIEAGETVWTTNCLIHRKDGEDYASRRDDYRELEVVEDTVELACRFLTSLDWEDPDIILTVRPTAAPSNHVSGLLVGVGSFAIIDAPDGVPRDEVCLSADRDLKSWLLQADTGIGRGHPPYSDTAMMAQALHSHYEEHARRP